MRKRITKEEAQLRKKQEVKLLIQEKQRIQKEINEINNIKPIKLTKQEIRYEAMCDNIDILAENINKRRKNACN